MRLAAAWLLAAVGLATPIAAQPAAPPDTPFIRIEAGGHAAPVTRLATDAAGTLLATASDDKTVRLWALPSGESRGVLRAPIGPEAEGELFAVALSPDGRRAYAGGITGFAWDRSFSIYLFDTATQRMLGRLSGLPAPINHIAVSADGSRLAAALGGQAGVKLWDARNGRLVAEDSAYRGPARTVVFAGDGRFFTASADGMVRAYDADGRKTAELTPRERARPYGLALSPDGALVAVGYENVAAVDILASAGLRRVFTPDVSGVPAAALPAVAWSSDRRGGVQLHAAGFGQQASGLQAGVIRRWADFGLGPARDITAARDSITHLLPLPTGGLAYAAADPGWGLLGPDGVVARAPRPAASDPRIARGALAVSADAQTVEWPGASGRLRFDISTRTLGPGSGQAVALAVLSSGGLAVTEWRDGTAPKLNNQRLALGRGEIARSAAIAGDRVLLGTDTGLRLFNRQGREIAAVATSGAVWALAVATGVDAAVAMLGDGTLRWFDLGGATPLAERGALFVHADGARWALFTPEGFFDHGEGGGQDLVGVHLNRGRAEQPDWASFAQAYRALYAPAVVRARLGGDAAAASRRLAELGDIRAVIARQPRVTLAGLCIPDITGDCRAHNAEAPLPIGATRVRLGLKLEDRGLGLGSVDVFLNGRNVGRVDPAGMAEIGIDIALDAGANALQVRAWDAAGRLFAETPALRLEALGMADAASRLFVMAVGVDRYRIPELALRYAAADATTVAETLRDGAVGLFAATEVTVLTDEAATKEGILAALERLSREIGPQDTFLLYLAGHGVKTEPDERFLFLPQDVTDASSWDALRRQGLSDEVLVGALSRIRARNGFLLMDTCYAGQVAVDALASVGNETGRYLLTASTSLQEALDSYDDQNGVFAVAVREALTGRAGRDERGVVSALALGEYVSRRVGVLAREKGHAQDAVFRTAQRDLRGFPLARVAR
ncbi:caspase family protein [Elioraea sp.]|uniref:caspase family protein n=1 Tax=Elioraea sp. TaxID=2185103 RepID=UPI0025BCEB4C|nr:caspase family protein [Elioraea sp.]